VERGGATGQPRIATGRYFGLGDDADAVTDEYILHYYGDESFPAARADTLTTLGHLRGAAGPAGGRRHRHAILYPTSDRLEQVVLLAEALRNTGSLLAHDHVSPRKSLSKTPCASSSVATTPLRAKTSDA
jgi:hypothetical protein